MATFEKDGRTRTVTTPAAAVDLRFRGWREVADASADEAQVQTVDETPAADEVREDELPHDAIDAG